MSTLFAETLKKLRAERGLSQKQLGERMFVNPSSVTRWEKGSRLPDAAMITRLAKVLEVDVGTLLSAAVRSDESPIVILVDDSKPVLSDGLAVLEEVMPNATITGFMRPCEAVEYAQKNQIALAILDIELGTASGLDLCRTLLQINPFTNVLYLTSYAAYHADKHPPVFGNSGRACADQQGGRTACMAKEKGLSRFRLLAQTGNSPYRKDTVAG